MTDISWQSLNWFDCAIIAVLGISALISLMRGFVREAISVVTWVVAIVVALKFALSMGDVLVPVINSPTARYIIAFVAILFGVLILGMIINAILRKVLKKSGISILDRLLGFFFGVGRGILLVGLILLLLRVSSLQDSPIINKSELAPRFVGVVNWLHDFLPEKMQQVAKWTQDETSDTPVATTVQTAVANTATTTTSAMTDPPSY